MSVRKYLGVAALFTAAVLTVKSCTEALFTKEGQEGTEFSERFGENLSDDTIGFVKGLFVGGAKSLEDIGDDTATYLQDQYGIDVDDYNSLEELEKALEAKGINISIDGNPCNDENYFMNPDCFGKIPGQEGREPE